MSVDFQELRELLSAIAKTDITEFTLKSDDFELTLRKSLVAKASEVTSTHQTLPTTTLDTPTAPIIDSSTVVTPETTASGPIDQKKLLDITSPMVGTLLSRSRT